MPTILRPAIAAFGALVLLASPAAALAATPDSIAPPTATVGSTAPAHNGEDSLFTGMQCISSLEVGSAPSSPSYVAPFDGRISSWSYRGQPAGAPYGTATAQLEVYRPLGPDRWQVVATSRPHRARPRRLDRFGANIAVKAGDILGLRATIGCAFTTMRFARDLVQTFGYQTAPGTVATPDGPGFGGGRLNVSATVAGRR